MSSQTLRADERSRQENPRAMSSGHVATHQIGARDSARALELAAECMNKYSSAEDPAFLTDVRVLAGELPQAIRRAVLSERFDEATHVVLVGGNSCDDTLLPATPGHWRDANVAAAEAHAILLMLYGALLGDAIGWATQQDGRLITDVLPVAGYERSLVSSSSERELGWHTEDAFSPHRADYVGLYCLRNPQQIPTTVAYLDPAAIPDRIGQVLRAPRFYTLPDTSHQAQAGRDGPGHVTGLRCDPPRVPVLDGAPEAPVLRIDSDFTAAVEDDREAAQALSWVTDHLNDNTYDLVLRPGDIVMLDNRKVVHGRRAFQARYDGTDRWLKRVNLVIDLRRTRPGRASATSRVIGP